MWIVRLALRRPFTVAVLAVLLMVLGAVSFMRMNVDIFPAIDLPVVIAVWTYPGLSATDMERRVVLISERAFSTTVNGIEHIESESVNGIGLIRIYFHPGTNVGGAIAQIASVSQTILKFVPPGMQAPNVIDYNAANVPVAQLNVYSDTLPEQELFDYGLNFIRVRLFTIEGLASPAPFGGVTRQVMVNLQPSELYAKGLSPSDVTDAVAAGNVILPAGTARIGNREYVVSLNGSPQTIEGLNDIPVKASTPTPVLLRDVAPVTDTHAVQTNVVRVDGRRATYLAILKHAAASTLRVVDQVKATLPIIRETAPKGLQMQLAFDQSVFVRGALWAVVREAAIAAALVALMVLVFLGSARSTLIVIVSIPLSILGAIIGLAVSGQTINIMSLGGLALAVGMLVDDATVEVENIHRNHAAGKPLLEAILAGAQQIAMPTFVGTLSICIVFAPIVMLQGVAKYLFLPLALAVVYAMLLSYLLSRTLVPSMARHLLPDEPETHEGAGWLARFPRAFEARFERVRESYRRNLGRVIVRRRLFLAVAAVAILASGLLLLVVGQDFFPAVDAGMMRLHVRAPTGTRIEETERLVDRVEGLIRDVIPADELDGISDNIGLPTSYNLAFYQTDSLGPQDADILVELRPSHRPTAGYIDVIRERVGREMPLMQIYSQAADIVGQVLNFGLSAPIDVQISGMDLGQSYALAERLKAGMAAIPGVRDVRIAQLLDYPTLRVDVDRAKALELGVSENAVASSLLTSLSSSFLTNPSFWLDPRNNVNYTVAVQTPFRNLDSIQALGRTPLHSNANGYTQTAATTAIGHAAPAQFLSNLASVRQDVQPAVINHYTVQRVIDVNCGTQRRDLGSVTAEVRRLVAGLGQLPPGTRIDIRGQSQAMRESFTSLAGGLVLAIVLVYLLMVANFQSWLEPFIIMLAVPGALAGVLWALVLTRTTLNVESMMGTVMAVGVAVANGNLLITFANELREDGYDPVRAAIEAARIRLRPVIMTALAMILGMLPMALALGEGGEQNAPLGRAVIGGLVAATATTLFVVPTVYAILARTLVTKEERDRVIAGAAGHVTEPPR
jgi:multidrug efflux pump subunit AcrB